MSYRTVDAGRGIEWIKRIIEVIKGNPIAFLVMGLILGVIAIIPVLGSLALLVLLPTFYAGFCWAAREQDQGRQADIKHLFQGFNEPGRLGPLVTLCLPQVAAGIVAFVLVVIFFGGAMLSGGLAAAGGDGNPLAIVGALGGGAFVLLVLMFALFIAVWMMLLFAIPKVMFDGEAPFDAMKESFAAALANLVPIIVFALVVGVSFMIIVAILGVIPFLPIAAVALLYAVIGVAHYVIWRDVFGASAATSELPPPPPG